MVAKHRTSSPQAAVVEGDDYDIGAIMETTGSPVRTPSMTSDADLESMSTTESALSLVRLCFTKVWIWTFKIIKYPYSYICIDNSANIDLNMLH